MIRVINKKTVPVLFHDLIRMFKRRVMVRQTSLLALTLVEIVVGLLSIGRGVPVQPRDCPTKDGHLY